MKLNFKRFFGFLYSFKNVILIWLLSHIFVFTLGFIVTYLNEGPSSPLSIIMRQFCRWDSNIYIDIAKNWYVNVGEQRLYIVFFPLYPLLIRLTTFDYQYINLSALLISNLSSLIASIYLFKLVKFEFEEDVAERAVLYLNIYPTAYFMSAIYTEALFLALIMTSVYYTRKERWSIAGILGFLATLTRSFGVVLLPTMLVEYFLQRKWRWRKIDKNILWTGLVFVGFIIYLFINYQVTGNPFTFMEIESSHWYQNLDPMSGLNNAWRWATTASFPDNIMLGSAQIIFAVLGLLSIVGSLLLHLRLSYAVYAFFTWMMSISTGWWISVPRYIMAVFPLFMLFGLFGRRRGFNYLAIAIFSTALYSFTILFSSGQWAF
ncbi:MAG: glycosyltransferase family 39 protein [Candidatus Bathyarchaeia archaeon]